MRFRMKKQAAAGALLVATVIAAAATQAGVGEPALNISRSTIDGGGGMHAGGGMYELRATTGQPDTGVSTGGDYQMSAAFWFQVLPGDFGEDGNIDLSDYAKFLVCATGPGGGVPREECGVFDVDQSGTIDLGDFALIQTSYTGP